MSASTLSRRRTLARRAAAFTCLILSAGGIRAHSWPQDMTRAITRDAMRLLPGSLARLLAHREDEIVARWSLPPTPLEQALYADLVSGDLRDETRAALDARVAEILTLLTERKVQDALQLLGAMARCPADLSDPILAVGPEGYPAGVSSQYYAFVGANLDKIPVTLVDAASLEIRAADLGPYWRRLLQESRGQSAVLRADMVHGGRVVDHRLIDYRSPVFAVGSLSYSRAVTAVAATWLAVWREAGGDMTQKSKLRTLVPVAAPQARPARAVAPEATSP